MRAVVVSILVAAAVFLNSCREEKLPVSEVRFKNIMVDHYEFPYGLMMGGAVYGGSLGFNEITEYIETKPGIFAVHAKRVDGEWIVISEGKFEILPGSSYTILIFGTVERFSFQISQD